MNIFVCGCIKSDYPYIRNDHLLVIRELDKYVMISFNNDIYVMCPEIINFCYQVNRWFFFGKTCDFNSGKNLSSCITNLRFGRKKICLICTEPLVKKLFPYFQKI